jgi:hypothetical protein
VRRDHAARPLRGRQLAPLAPLRNDGLAQQTDHEALGLGDPLNFNCDGVNGRLEPLLALFVVGRDVAWLHCGAFPPQNTGAERDADECGGGHDDDRHDLGKNQRFFHGTPPGSPDIRKHTAEVAPERKRLLASVVVTGMTQPAPEFLDLQTALAGEYSIQRELGRGGMGIVYLARDVQLDRDVAIKVLPAHMARTAESRQRFVREARTAAGLSHPNIVPIHRVGEASGFVFFVMSYIKGETLAQTPGRVARPYARRT